MVANLYIFLLFLVAVAAFGCGGWEAQASIAIKVASATLSVMFANPSSAYSGISQALVTIDFGTLCAITFIALKSSAFWPLWTAALQLLVFAAVFAPLASGLWHPLTYAINEQIWSWPLLATVGVMAIVSSVRRGDHREEAK